MTNPIVGGKQAAFTGLEDFDIPFDFGSGSNASGSSGSIGSDSRSSSSGSMPSFETESSEASSGGISATDIQKQQMMMQMAKTREDFARMVKQAKFFLPRTLEGIAGQYGTQGSYWSSGRRDAQQEAAAKTKFDLAQAKSDAEFEIKNTWMELAAMSQSEQSGRSA